jgi:hypothetical protein
LPGATTQAKACGASTATHQSYGDAARRARGDAAGTRSLTEVLLVHRTLPAMALITGVGLEAGALDSQVVLVDARREISG